MARSGDIIANPVTRERVIFRQTTLETNGELLEFDDILEAGGIGPPEHVHLRQVERFEVITGTMGLRLAGRERILRTGETVSVDPNTAHRWWNAGDDPVCMRTQFRPGLQLEIFFETLFGLAREGQLDAKGMPRFLQVAVLVPPFEMYLAKPPVPLQKALFAVLGPVAARRGYRVAYPKYSASWDLRSAR
jgi:quercetin dioxygenase-like cupin family protein